MVVAVASSIQVTPINDTSVCAGNAVPLTGTLIQGATYQWTPSTGLSNPAIPNPMASPDKTTNYVLTVSTPDGCQGKDSVLVTVADNPVITMNNDATVCMGEKITLQAQSPGAKQYQWSPATGLSDARNARPIATISSTTTYSVTVTNTSGCESTDDVTITAAPLPTVNILKPNDIDCAHGDVQLQASGGASYQWSPAIGLDDPNSPNPIAKPVSSTEYTVTATSVDGCEAEASVMVDVNAYPTETLNIPSAFTPNGDGLNDCFGLRTANLVSPFQFEVYNRWGQKVFETSNTSICWDGTFKGTAQPGDAYVWQVRVKGECGDTYKKGTVVLIR